MADSRPIGVFDSGVGGLSVLRHLQAALPHEHLLYIADQAHIPYRNHSLETVYQFSKGITEFLLAHHAKMIVIACNKASGAALTQLRLDYPHIPFVGMEPAVKPAAVNTRTKRVAVLATAGTFESERYTRLMDQYAQGVTVWEDPCIGLVEMVEAGQVDTPETERLLERVLYPMLANGVDTVVLGCTHYPFVESVIARVVGTAVTIIDPAPAVARQTVHVLHQHHLQTNAVPPGSLRLITSGAAPALAAVAAQLIGYQGTVETAVWQPQHPLQLTIP